MRFAQNLEVRNSKLGFAPKAFRSTAKPMSPETIRGSWICREDFGIERNQSFKERETVTHNSVFAAHRLQCRMTNRKNRHPAFCFSFVRGLPVGITQILQKPTGTHGAEPDT
jgi:hypothetical protein